MKHWHRCDRWEKKKVACPFRKLRGHEADGEAQAKIRVVENPTYPGGPRPRGVPRPTVLARVARGGRVRERGAAIELPPPAGGGQTTVSYDFGIPAPVWPELRPGVPVPSRPYSQAKQLMESVAAEVPVQGAQDAAQVEEAVADAVSVGRSNNWLYTLLLLPAIQSAMRVAVSTAGRIGTPGRMDKAYANPFRTSPHRSATDAWSGQVRQRPTGPGTGAGAHPGAGGARGRAVSQRALYPWMYAQSAKRHVGMRKAAQVAQNISGQQKSGL